MRKPDIPENELDRLRELDAYNIFEAAEQEDFDFLTYMAAQICETKISLITLVTRNKQCFLSQFGLDLGAIPRDLSFCGHAIFSPEKPFIIEDARLDDRFLDNPLTADFPFIVFYAGIPLVNSNGYPLGTLCVIDDKPRQLNSRQIRQLEQLAKQTIMMFELRRSQIALIQANDELEKFSYIAAHDLKEPLRGVTTFLSIFKKKYSDQLDETALSYIDNAYNSAQRMKKLIMDILDFSKTGTVGRENVDLNELLEAVFSNYKQANSTTSVKLSKTNMPSVIGDASAFIQVFTNLIDNAIKYQPKGNSACIHISADEDDKYWTIIVADNGIGIAPQHQKRVFEVFKRLHTESEYSGTGIGLANCKKIVAALGGKIWYEANMPVGTIFKFSIPKY